MSKTVEKLRKAREKDKVLHFVNKKCHSEEWQKSKKTSKGRIPARLKIIKEKNNVDIWLMFLQTIN